jgi:hypothetical protein
VTACNVPLLKTHGRKGIFFLLSPSFVLNPSYPHALTLFIIIFFVVYRAISHAEDEINYHRLGWINKSDIQKLPLDQQPTINKACNGAWLTPISKTIRLLLT